MLGVFEAGLFRGIVLYLTHWFPATRQAAAIFWSFLWARRVCWRAWRLVLRIGHTRHGRHHGYVRVAMDVRD